MIEKLVRLKCDILALKLQIVIKCFAIVLAFMVVVMIVCLVWWILDEIQGRR